MTTYITRAQWGARNPNGSRNALSSSPKGHAIHWEGPTMGIGSHSECAGIVRGIQSYHMGAPNYWADIAYNLIPCPHDYVFEGRGKGVGSSANGTTQANHDWYAICALVGEGDPQPPGLISAIQYAADLCRSWGAGGGSTGHRDHIATECPGDALYAMVQAGTFTSAGGGTPIPDPGPPPDQPPGKVPTFPYPASHYLGQESPDPACHSGYYVADQPNIITWQRQMAARGWTIDADGYYGPQSETVCRQFQTDKGLDLDGLVGPDTWGAAWTAPVT